ncbi:MAG: beta-lactamase family protein [Prosthecobacter sp.]|jgi:CubicO group peptidase (beta-lactamase class C family)|uniref:serine hydrolase domain-containing protein n=1 Tax=Prosthecobacter sp. TaxID=1965333 RepID=UPI001A07AF8C|nr:serine hydrolase domain-containing protein [Prosthecobacter sp.]MBE2286192.1 beta-lactamase family protein [Prosthecobacter sp.]
MNRRDTLALTLSALGLPISARSAMPSAHQIIQHQIDHGTLHNAVLHVRRGDEVTQHVFGKAQPDSMFLLGSITKPLAVALPVLILLDRGALKLSDHAVKYLPEFSEGARKDITIEQLLTHTSGLPDQLGNNAELRARHALLAEFVKGAMRTPLLFAPGTQYHYQSMGILLAAEIVERVTKTALPDFLQQHVFSPLGMTRSVLGLGQFKKSEMVSMQTEHAAPEAGGGDPKAREWDWNSDYWRNLGAPWGGAHSSAADVATFLRIFLHPDGKLLREETARLAITDHTPTLSAHRGIGFMAGPVGLGKGCSARAFGHSGSTGTLAWADPATDTTFVLLTALPKNVSGDLILYPASDLISA